MKKALQEEIARVAYDLFEKKGRREGCHFEDWIEAERIVMYERAGELEKKAALKTPKTKAAAAAPKEKKSVAKAAGPKTGKTATRKKTTKE